MSTGPPGWTNSQCYYLLIPSLQISSFHSRVSFRCGLFFPDPKNAGAVPVAPLFIFNNSWSADECPAGNKARYNKFCDSIVGPPHHHTQLDLFSLLGEATVREIGPP